MRQPGMAGATDVSINAGEAAASDLSSWLAGALATTEHAMQDGLIDRCIALLSAGEGVGFTITYALTPVLLQPHFCLMVSPLGEVRIVWFAYVTDSQRPDMQFGEHIVRMFSDDLNAVASGLTAGMVA